MEKNKKLLLTHGISFGILLIGFLMCRFAFFELHGMREWPFDLWIAGVVVILVSMMAKKQLVPWFTTVGYFLGFLAGVIFHTEGVDPGGGRTDNLWQIWMVVFVVCILAGVIFEIVIKWWRLLYKKNL